MTADELLVSLQERFCPPQYAFLPAVRDSTGMGSKRTADAIAMSLWKSRGLELIGFEIKITRRDWIREVRDPEKADEILRYCDRWYVVCSDKALIKPGELPPTWGLIVPRGKQVIVEVEAPKLEACGLNRPFIAALLRRASAMSPSAVAVNAAIRCTRNEERQRYESQRKLDVREAELKLQHLEESLKQFEEKSGVKIGGWNGEQIGEAVRVVLKGRVGDLRREFESIRKTAEGIVRDATILLSEDGGPPDAELEKR